MRNTIVLKIIFRSAIFIFFTVIIIFSFILKNETDKFYQSLEVKIESELTHSIEIIQDNYLIGDFISLRKYLNSFSSLNYWEGGSFFDINSNLIWDYYYEIRSDKYLKSNLFISIILKSPSSKNHIIFNENGNFLIKKIRDVNLKNSEKIGKIEIIKNITPDIRKYSEELRSLVIMFISVSVFLGSGMIIILSKTISPLKKIKGELFQEALKIGANLSEPRSYENEIDTIRHWFKEISLSWKNERDTAIEQSRFLTFAQLATQVAHDIRSPIAALKSLDPDLSLLPERSRLVIKNSISRIQDIANNLLIQSRTKANSLTIDPSPFTEPATHHSPAHLSLLIDELLSEKRAQFKNQKTIHFEFESRPHHFNLFSTIPSSDLKRIISNLLNNAVEAQIAAHSSNQAIQIKIDPPSFPSTHATIHVTDHGCGIPADILPQLMQRGATFGKVEGSGLGLWHAKETLEKNGGSIQMTSTLQQGTSVTLSIPLANSPEWFTKSIRIQPDTAIVVFDDDPMIFQIWRDRFSDILRKNSSITIRSFESPGALTDYLTDVNLEKQSHLLLMDHEIAGFKQTGLGLIEGLALAPHSILVTNRFEDPEVIRRCERNHLSLLPKLLVHLVPIHIDETQKSKI